MTSLPNQSLFLSKAFSDVTFIVDNESIPAHKMLLAANCPFFQTMLFGSTNESKMSSIELNNVSQKTFVEVLRCVYLRKVDISEWTPEEVKNLVQKADEYQFPDMGSVIADSLNIDTQVTIDIIEDVVGVAKRLNCNQLMKKCVQAARKRTEFLFSNVDAFDKLPMDFIIHLIDKRIWNPADARLVYSIGNWRKMTASIEDKKVLLSKIDWKSLPAKYSEPLVRMFLENDEDDLRDEDWTDGLKKSIALTDLIASIYCSNQAPFSWNNISTQYTIPLTYERRQECVIFFFRETINLTKINFKYDGEATITLKLNGEGEERKIIGTRTGNLWQFNLALCGSFSSAALHFEDPNINFNNKYSSHTIYNLTFCHN